MPRNLSPFSLRPIRGLARRVALTLAVLGLMAAGGMAAALSVLTHLEGQREAGDLVNDQRLLTQRAALLAEKLEQPASEAPLHRQRYRAELESAVHRLRDGSFQLILDNRLPVEVTSLYATAWDEETGVMARFHAAMLAVLNGDGATAGVNHREALLFNEEAARRHAQAAKAELERLRLRVLLAGAALLLVGAAAWGLGLHPVLRTVRGQVRRLSFLGDAIIDGGHGVLMLDGRGTIIYANAQAGRFSGHGEALAGLDLGRVLFSAHGQDSADAILQAAARDGWRGDARLIRQDGVAIWAEMVVWPVAGHDGFLVILFDATRRREAEARQRQARERLSAAVEAIDEGFALFDADDHLVVCNRGYGAHLPQLDPWLVPGVVFSDLLGHLWTMGVVETDLSQERFVAQRLAHFRAGHGASEMRLKDGRVLRATDRRTPEGGRVSVLADITVSANARQHLREALERAEAASGAKSAFLSAMSHELRTPLHTILGHAQLLETSAEGTLTPAQRRSVGQVVQSAQLLEEMIAQVLELSDLEAGKILVDTAVFDLAAVARDGVAAAAALALADKVTVRGHGFDRPVQVRGDGARMAEVLSYLLSNAVKFNRPGGTVEVGLAASGDDRVRLSVADSGQGIAVDRQGSLFQPFGAGAPAAGGGVGVGLSIARALVERMGGCIGFASVEGQGSTFWVDVPLAAGRPPVGELAGHVLLVDDDPLHRRVLELVEQANPDLHLWAAEDSVAAERILAQGYGFDLIVVDLSLGGSDGIELCQRLRGDPLRRFTPVVALTNAEQARSGAVTLTSLGFDAALAVPLEVAELSATLRRFCFKTENENAPALPPAR